MKLPFLQSNILRAATGAKVASAGASQFWGHQGDMGVILKVEEHMPVHYVENVIHGGFPLTGVVVGFQYRDIIIGNEGVHLDDRSVDDRL